MNEIFLPSHSELCACHHGNDKKKPFDGFSPFFGDQTLFPFGHLVWSCLIVLDKISNDNKHLIKQCKTFCSLNWTRWPHQSQTSSVNVLPFSHSVQQHVWPPTTFDLVWLPNTSRLEGLLKILLEANRGIIFSPLHAYFTYTADLLSISLRRCLLFECYKDWFVPCESFIQSRPAFRSSVV